MLFASGAINARISMDYTSYMSYALFKARVQAKVRRGRPLLITGSIVVANGQRRLTVLGTTRNFEEFLSQIQPLSSRYRFYEDENGEFTIRNRSGEGIACRFRIRSLTMEGRRRYESLMADGGSKDRIIRLLNHVRYSEKIGVIKENLEVIARKVEEDIRKVAEYGRGLDLLGSTVYSEPAGSPESNWQY